MNLGVIIKHVNLTSEDSLYNLWNNMNSLTLKTLILHNLIKYKNRNPKNNKPKKKEIPFRTRNTKIIFWILESRLIKNSTKNMYKERKTKRYNKNNCLKMMDFINSSTRLKSLIFRNFKKRWMRIQNYSVKIMNFLNNIRKITKILWNILSKSLSTSIINTILFTV
jgi:hypothetical protein